MRTRKFILIDDNEEFRNALRILLVNLFKAEIIGEASNAEEALLLDNYHKADIILMDVMMPGKSGIELTHELLWKQNQLRIIAVTMHFDKIYLTSLVTAGFKGCVFKNDLVNQLPNAIEMVEKGKLYFPEEILVDIEND